jgi:hypothetical protein
MKPSQVYNRRSGTSRASMRRRARRGRSSTQDAVTWSWEYTSFSCFQPSRRMRTILSFAMWRTDYVSVLECSLGLR